MSGIVFGIFLGLYFSLFRKKIAIFSLFILILLSTGAYYVALGASIFLYFLPGPVGSTASLIIAGSIGTAVLLLGVRAVVSIEKKAVLTLIGLGGILGLSFFIIPDSSIFPNEYNSWGPAKESFLSLFLFWQLGMMVAIGAGTDHKTTKK